VVHPINSVPPSECI